MTRAATARSGLDRGVGLFRGKPRLPRRDDFTFPTSNKQFCFVQHIYRGLAPGGRAAASIAPEQQEIVRRVETLRLRQTGSKPA